MCMYIYIYTYINMLLLIPWLFRGGSLGTLEVQLGELLRLPAPELQLK